jgi:hypothetical protein
VHDRRVDGETLVFGNQGALFMRAMTWWDHQTESVWSQPWGTAVAGTLKDTALTLIPASIVPWETWRLEHPDTTVLSNDLDRFRNRVHLTRDDFVIGVALEDAATGYAYRLASRERIINDTVGEHPVVVIVDPETRDVRVYLRRATAQGSESPMLLTFDQDSQGRVVDVETGTVWNVRQGVATDGALKGAQLQQVPWVSSFDWAWLDFFPHTLFYQGE